MGFIDQLKERIPMFFIVLGLAFLGFGRKASKFQEAGGQLPEPTIHVILILIGIGILIYQKYSAKRNT